MKRHAATPNDQGLYWVCEALLRVIEENITELTADDDTNRCP